MSANETEAFPFAVRLHLAAVLIAILTLVTVLAGSARALTSRCRTVTVPVSLSQGSAANQRVNGRLCLPAAFGLSPDRAGSVVQLVMSGATYGQVYWDFPYKPEDYSFVRAMNAAGFATFDFDRVGVGKSSHPPSSEVTLNADAWVAHQLVADLRDGAIGRFAKVELVAHSLGSSVAWIEAGSYKDVDAVIISDETHKDNLSFIAHAEGDLYPANLDPRFQGQGLDGGYLTTVPGTRGSLFYNTADADPNVISVDEATKETVTIPEISAVQGSLDPSISQQIDVPVLVVAGQDDALMCGAGATDCSTAATLYAAEAPDYSARACLNTFVLPLSGHDVNLALNAGEWFRVAALWSRLHVGWPGVEQPQSPSPVPEVCRPGPFVGDAVG